MQIRQLEYLLALARERHFGRAAESCSISQPALSQALRHIETTFGVPIVDRRQQGFHAFTREGHLILEWARKIVADHDILVQELSGVSSGGLTGHIRIGVIPVAMPMVSMLTTAFSHAHSGITISVLSMNFMEIERRLATFDIEIGVNYLRAEQPTGLRSYVLYDETYYLLAPEKHLLANRTSITWQEAGALPLCLLTPDMQNRRLLNLIFEQVGVEPRTVIETDCAIALCSHVRSGQWFTIVPHTFFYLIGDSLRTRAVPLVKPVASNAVGLLIPERYPLPPIVHAFIESAQNLDLTNELKKHIPVAASESAA